MKKKDLTLYGMKIVQRDWMPSGEAWITNIEAPVELFETTHQTRVRGTNQHAIKGRFITKFKNRRFGKLTPIEGTQTLPANDSGGNEK